jgi:hypothetical protein
MDVYKDLHRLMGRKMNRDMFFYLLRDYKYKYSKPFRVYIQHLKGNLLNN